MSWRGCTVYHPNAPAPPYCPVRVLYGLGRRGNSSTACMSPMLLLIASPPTLHHPLAGALSSRWWTLATWRLCMGVALWASTCATTLASRQVGLGRGRQRRRRRPG